jgi:hypothetical protein
MCTCAVWRILSAPTRAQGNVSQRCPVIAVERAFSPCLPSYEALAQQKDGQIAQRDADARKYQAAIEQLKRQARTPQQVVKVTRVGLRQNSVPKGKNPQRGAAVRQPAPDPRKIRADSR